MLQSSFRFWHQGFNGDLMTLDISSENLRALMGPYSPCLASSHPALVQDPMLDPWGHRSLPQGCHSSARTCPAAPGDLQGAASPRYPRQTPSKAMLPNQCQMAVLSKSDLKLQPIKHSAPSIFSFFFNLSLWEKELHFMWFLQST